MECCGPKEALPFRRRLVRGLRLLVLPVITCVLVIGVLEAVGWILFSELYPQYEKMRKILVSHKGGQRVASQGTTGQPYLLYIPAPNLERREHNEHGYRGALVPRERRDGYLRILCMGGSTTYGWCVPKAADTYPAQLQDILEAVPLPRAYREVEVINAGMPWGSSAELLTHFHFKFRYYRPDVVVINTGGNDALLALEPYYHPDYSHCRQALPTVRPLPASSRWFLRSRIMAFLAIHLFYSDIAGGQPFTRRGALPSAPWYTTEEHATIADTDLAFRQNLLTLVREVKRAGAQVVLVPFRHNPAAQSYSSELVAQIERNERILCRIAEQERTGIAPFPLEAISGENWADGCHLNAAGCKEKAQHIAPSILALLKPH